MSLTIVRRAQPAFVDEVHLPLLPLIEASILKQEIGEADDTVERGTDFVAHIGERSRLRIGGALGLLPCFAHFHYVGDVLDRFHLPDG